MFLPKKKNYYSSGSEHLLPASSILYLFPKLSEFSYWVYKHIPLKSHGNIATEYWTIDYRNILSYFVSPLMATRRTSRLSKPAFAAIGASRTSHKSLYHSPSSFGRRERLLSGFPSTPVKPNVRNFLSRTEIINGVAERNVASAQFLSYTFTRQFHASNPSYRSATSSQVSFRFPYTDFGCTKLWSCSWVEGIWSFFTFDLSVSPCLTLTDHYMIAYFRFWVIWTLFVNPYFF